MKDQIKTIIINPHETKVELQTTDDTSFFGTRLDGLETKIAELEKQIQLMKDEVGYSDLLNRRNLEIETSRLVELNIRIQQNHAELEKQIQSIKKEIGETGRPPSTVDLEEKTAIVPAEV